jgi:hypothetical protein
MDEHSQYIYIYIYIRSHFGSSHFGSSRTHFGSWGSFVTAAPAAALFLPLIPF